LPTSTQNNGNGGLENTNRDNNSHNGHTPHDEELFIDLEPIELGPKPKRERASTMPTANPAERALLVGVGQEGDLFEVQDSLDELAQLCETAGVAVVGRIFQNINRAHSAFLIGSGKVQEVKRLKSELEADVVIFDIELTPTQTRELEEALDVKLLDRTGLILDIFAKRARTHEGRLQVELAQMEYRLPRLTRLWTHLSRQTGNAGVGVRGPGETQLEIDRRESRNRIAHLKRELEHVHTHRELYRRRRKSEGMPVVALVGYTNAGKSTLLNKLSNAGVLAEDKLFATLDPTTRRVKLPNGREILLTDTVGFIQRLPTNLVEAFRSTLEEVNEADVLLHVLDFTHPNAQEQSETVESVLKELGADEKPRIVALNKIDMYRGAEGGIVSSEELAREFKFPANYVPISASKGIGLDMLLETIQQMLDKNMVEVEVFIPYDSKQELVSIFHQKGLIEHEEHRASGTYLKGKLPAQFVHRYADYPASAQNLKTA
jgi:GTPase